MSNHRKQLLVQAICAMSVAYIGWNYPRDLIQGSLSQIAHKVVPYQTTKAGDVILDGVHNRPLIDPPTIPCKRFQKQKLVNIQTLLT